MVRSLYVFFLSVLLLGPTQMLAHAAKDLSPESITECTDVLNNLNQSFQTKDWKSVYDISSRAEECAKNNQIGEGITYNQIIEIKAEALFELDKMAEIYELVNEVRRAREGRSYPVRDATYAYTLYYAYMAADRQGKDDEAYRFITSAETYLDGLSAENQFRISLQKIYASASTGRYQHAFYAVDDARAKYGESTDDCLRNTKINEAAGIVRLYHAIYNSSARQVSLPIAIKNLKKARIDYREADKDREAYVAGALSVGHALRYDATQAESLIDRAHHLAASSSQPWLRGQVKVFSARLYVMNQQPDLALIQLESAAADLEASRRVNGLSELEELRALAHNLNGRIDLAARSMWRLNMMEAPGAEHRMRMASASIIGIGSFLPWGIATALLCLAAGFVAVHGTRRLQQLLPEPDPNIHYMSMGFPFFSRRSRPNDASDPAPLADRSMPAAVERLTELMPDPPSFSDLYRDPQIDTLEEDPRSARALHLLNLTSGDAEQLFAHVTDAVPNFPEPPKHVRLSVSTSHSVDPVGHHGDRPVYECALTDRRFSLAPSGRPTVLAIDLGPDADPDLPVPVVVLHPSIFAEGPDTVLRAIALLGARRTLDGLDALREGITMDRGIWGSSLPEDDAPFIPAWRDV